MDIWQGIALAAPILVASRFAVRSRIRRDDAAAAAELDAFNAQWRDYQHRFIDETRLTARF